MGGEASTQHKTQSDEISQQHTTHAMSSFFIIYIFSQVVMEQSHYANSTNNRNK